LSEEFVEANKDYAKIIHELNALRWGAGMLAKKHLGWMGDYREQYVTSLPDHAQGCQNKLVFAWKQGSKGLAFVASPYPLTWLNHLMHVIDTGPIVVHPIDEDAVVTHAY
jgi:hypothetical protein